MKLCFLVVVAFLSISQIFCQNKCADIPAIQGFDASRYLGLWYEMERFDYIFEFDLKCVIARYGQLNDTAVSVYNRGVNEKTGLITETRGYATIPNPNAPNKLSVILPVVIGGSTVENASDYEVIESDYDTYALVYSCFKLGTLKLFDTAWILSRGKQLDEAKIQQLKAKAESLGLEISRFIKVKQDC